MKKIIIVSAITMFFSGSASAQMWDAKDITYDITLNQILRISVTGGGNVEFAFTNMDQYRDGISNAAFYNTNIKIASSSNWQLNFGADDPTFCLCLLGNDDPGNQMNLDNVGYMISVSSGNIAGDAITTGAADGTELVNGAAGADATPVPLTAYPDVIMQPVALGAGNGGDNNDLFFTINWECATVALRGVTLEPSILEQSIASDRYVTTVFLDIETVP